MFINQLICDTWCELSKIDSSEVEWKCKNYVTKRVLALLEDVLLDLKNNDELAEVALSWLG